MYKVREIKNRLEPHENREKPVTVIVVSEIFAVGAPQKPVSCDVAKNTPGPEVREAEGRSRER